MMVKKIPFVVDKDTDSEEECEYLSADQKETDPKKSDTLDTQMSGNKCKNRKFSSLTPYRETIICFLNEGIHQAEIIRRLWGLGYEGGKSNAEYYVKSIREEYNIIIPKRTSRKKQKPAGISLNGKNITEKELMEYIWMDKRFTTEERDILSKSHPSLLYAESCVRKFKKIFSEKKIPLLYLFIEEYLECPVKMLSRFAKGLQNDIEAIVNAVASEKSNGFVEGINSLIKMIKRTMFGRCKTILLSAKLMFKKWSHT